MVLYSYDNRHSSYPYPEMKIFEIFFEREKIGYSTALRLVCAGCFLFRFNPFGIVSRMDTRQKGYMPRMIYRLLYTDCIFVL